MLVWSTWKRGNRCKLSHIGIEVIKSYHAAHDQFGQDVMDGVRVEDQIQFADVLEALVQCFNKHLEGEGWGEYALVEMTKTSHSPESNPGFPIQILKSPRRTQSTVLRSGGRLAYSRIPR